MGFICLGNFFSFDERSKAYLFPVLFNLEYFFREFRSWTLKIKVLVWINSSICLFLICLSLWNSLIRLGKVISASRAVYASTDLRAGTPHSLFMQNNSDFTFYKVLIRAICFSSHNSPSSYKGIYSISVLFLLILAVNSLTYLPCLIPYTPNMHYFSMIPNVSIFSFFLFRILISPSMR